MSTMKTLQVGDKAPDFTLETHIEGELNLSWYQGRNNVVLAFYPGDFTLVCTDHMTSYIKIFDQLEKYDCKLFGISVDSIACHTAWAKSIGGLPFPLFSDYYPHGEVAEKYGVLTERGNSRRTVFLIDKEGIIRFIDHVDFNLIPDNENLLKELAKISV